MSEKIGNSFFGFIANLESEKLSFQNLFKKLGKLHDIH